MTHLDWDFPTVQPPSSPWCRSLLSPLHTEDNSKILCSLKHGIQSVYFPSLIDSRYWSMYWPSDSRSWSWSWPSDQIRFCRSWSGSWPSQYIFLFWLTPGPGLGLGLGLDLVTPGHGLGLDLATPPFCYSIVKKQGFFTMVTTLDIFWSHVLHIIVILIWSCILHSTTSIRYRVFSVMRFISSSSWYGH